MCGLFGAVGANLNENDVNVVKELGFLSALRGMDSTGVGLVFRKHGKKFRNVTSYSMMKSIDHSVDFLFQGDFDNVIRSQKDTLCIMGHTRAATVGRVTKDNAHPFHKGHIIGAHNGCVPKWEREQKALDKTDSERLITEIADKGLIGGLEDAGEYAAWGLSILDTERNALTLTCNVKRPLALMRTLDGKKIFWASDPMFLELVQARYQDKIKFGEVEYFSKHSYLTWYFGNAKTEQGTLEPDYSMKAVALPWRSWNKDTKEKTSADEEDDYFSRKTEHGYPEREGPFKTQEEIEIARSKALPIYEPPGKKIVPINKHVEGMRTSETSVEPAFRVYPSVPCYGYPEILILNEHRKVLQYMDWNGHFIGKSRFATAVSKGCMLTGQVATMSDRVWWLDDRTYVLDEFIKDQLVIDHIKSLKIIPRIGQGVYISPRLLLDANHKKDEDAIESVRLAREQLHDFGRFMFDPAFKEEVECH